MREIGAEYQSLLESRVIPMPATAPFFSTVTGNPMLNFRDMGPSYWRSNLESPVLFNSASSTILSEISQDKLFLEIGPHSALAGPLRQIFQATEVESPPVYVPTMLRGKNCTSSLLAAVGQLHLQGVPIKFDTITPGKVVLTNLPNYPWHHENKHWNESRVTREWRLRKFSHHELLGSRILEGNDLEPAWRNMLRLEDVPWIQDHKIIDDIVFPAAGYVTMAGEAIRQVTTTEDFTLRQVAIQTALVLQDSKAVEMMTSLRPLRLTNALDSVWYEFSISSFNETIWTKHCVGQVRPGSDQSMEPANMESFARSVSASSWYAAMKRLGLNYGPAFQGMKDITAGPGAGAAATSLTDRSASSESTYQLHPTTIDQCLQLFTVAMAEGTTRRLTNLCVPTNIENLYIRGRQPEIRAKAIASSSEKGSISGDVIAMADGQIVLQLQQGRFSPLEDQSPAEEANTMAGAQLQWKPDIEFVPVDKTMGPCNDFRDEICALERLTLLCILEIRHLLLSIETKVDHLRKFRTWIDHQAIRAESAAYDLVQDAGRLVQLSSEERLALIQATKKEMENRKGAEIGDVMLRILQHCGSMLAETIEPIAILVEQDGLNHIYRFMADMWDCRNFYQLLGHATPNMRVLEIGAGTGGTTAGVLKDLKTKSDERMYSEYSYTDISAAFFVAAKERFKEYQNIHYAVLDISKDPIDQGFEEGSYDLIIASNVRCYGLATLIRADKGY